MNLKRRGDILSFIGSYLHEHGVPPTVREIAKEVGVSSSSTLHSYLVRMERDKKIINIRGKYYPAKEENNDCC